MKTYLDCIPCFFRQALRAARAATDDPAIHKRVVDKLGSELAELDLSSSPPKIANLVYTKVRRVTGVDDPYAAAKREATLAALALYPDLAARVQAADDPLLAAIRYATVANTIDLGALEAADVRDVLGAAEAATFAVFDYEDFRHSLSRAAEIVYIGDNAGESVLDRLLIEQLGKPVLYVVRDGPIINDVTFDDAVLAGLDRVATVVSSGSRLPGLVPSDCSPEVRERLSAAQMVISKGQGNYEGLSGERVPVFFLLRAKCEVVARELGVTTGELVLKAGSVPSPDRVRGRQSGPSDRR
jgi:uncharacterized protein with ATP-grasp and redox domains